MTIEIVERRRREKKFLCLDNERMLLPIFQVFFQVFWDFVYFSRFFPGSFSFPGFSRNFQVFPGCINPAVYDVTSGSSKTFESSHHMSTRWPKTAHFVIFSTKKYSPTAMTSHAPENRGPRLHTPLPRTNRLSSQHDHQAAKNGTSYHFFMKNIFSHDHDVTSVRK